MSFRHQGGWHPAPRCCYPLHITAHSMGFVLAPGFLKSQRMPMDPDCNHCPGVPSFLTTLSPPLTVWLTKSAKVSYSCPALTWLVHLTTSTTACPLITTQLHMPQPVHHLTMIPVHCHGTRTWLLLCINMQSAAKGNYSGAATWNSLWESPQFFARLRVELSEPKQ